MNKKFILNLVLLLLLNFLIKPFYIIGIDAEIQNRVGAEIYGQYFSLLSFSFLLNIVLDVGIVNYNTRNISQHSFLLQKYFGHIISLRLLLSFAYVLITFAFAFILGYEQSSLVILGWLVLNQILASLILYVRSNLAGLLLFKRDSIVSVLDRFLLIVICGLLLWGGITEKPFEIFWFIWAQTFAYGVTFLIALYFLISKQKVSKLRFKKKISLSILKKSFPYALLILLMTVYYRSDSVMLERMLEDGKTQAGIYANGFRFFEAANNIALLFATLLLPLFANLIKNNKSIESLVSLSFRILMSGAIAISLICFYYSFNLMSARYSFNNEESSVVFGLLMFCFVFISSTYIFGTLLTANGDLKTLNKIAFAGVILNIGLNLVLIPLYKAYGAAIASLVTQGLTAVAQVLLSKRYFNLKTNYFLILKMFIYSVLMLSTIYVIIKSDFSFLTWYYEILIDLIISIVLIFVLRIFKISEVKLLFLSYKKVNND
jgi:O-antigen/teichoic acid export membrane protein